MNSLERIKLKLIYLRKRDILKINGLYIVRQCSVYDKRYFVIIEGDKAVYIDSIDKNAGFLSDFFDDMEYPQLNFRFTRIDKIPFSLGEIQKKWLLNQKISLEGMV